MKQYEMLLIFWNTGATQQGNNKKQTNLNKNILDERIYLDLLGEKSILLEQNNENKKKMKEILKEGTFEEFRKYELGIEYYKEFLSERMIVEPLLFYCDLQEFKMSFDQKHADQLVHYFLKQYIYNTSIFYIELEQKSRDVIIKRWGKDDYSIDMFDNIEEKMYKIISTAHFQQFKDSYLYKEFEECLLSDNHRFQNQKYQFGEFCSTHITENILNMNIEYKLTNTKPFYELSYNLINQLIKILSQNFLHNFGVINCKKIIRSIKFQKFLQNCSKLQKIDIKKLLNATDIQKKYFFLNLYNIITMHSLIVNEHPHDYKTFKHFLCYSKYNVGGKIINLADIKFGIFRLGHKKKEYHLPKEWEGFQMEKCDHRIHFALISSSSVSPTLSPFLLKNCNKQLDKFRNTFINKYISVNRKKKKVILPRLFLKYWSDFVEEENQIISWLQKFLKVNNLSILDFSLKPIKFKINQEIKFKSKK
ncbi:electron carrier/ protein disulfide oxidoreductase [Anaeramoeba flamelloides]|uniref:Electron carrier/ protein disulfide oxidoreductase n=1 Tax=Anaeramoeba flamelloides TaxID=1746091 RepID=A0ABQ8Y6S9_9EUKA|nr:electron carrier/ protein disulfide oxidoreductase [Anaeramoeba flamelloides]